MIESKLAGPEPETKEETQYETRSRCQSILVKRICGESQGGGYSDHETKFYRCGVGGAGIAAGFRHGTDCQGAGQTSGLSVRADREKHELRQFDEQTDLGRRQLHYVVFLRPSRAHRGQHEDYG